MDRTQLQTKIASVKPGQKLKLAFNDNAKHGGLNYLFGMNKAGVILIEKADRLTLEMVAMSRDWDGNKNKFVTIHATATFDQGWFVDRMYRELDGVEVLN